MFLLSPKLGKITHHPKIQMSPWKRAISRGKSSYTQHFSIFFMSCGLKLKRKTVQPQGTGTMEASTISGAAGSDPFGSAGPTVGISTSGFRLPKGKEERDDSKARKKKKKKSLWFWLITLSLEKVFFVWIHYFMFRWSELMNWWDSVGPQWGVFEITVLCFGFISVLKKKGWVLPATFSSFFLGCNFRKDDNRPSEGRNKCCETFTLSPCEKTEEGEERGWFGWLWVSALLSHKSPISFSATPQITYPPHMLVLRSRLIHKSWWRDWMIFVRICCWYHLFNMNPCSSSTAVTAIKLFLKQMGVWHSYRVMKAFQCT